MTVIAEMSGADYFMAAMDRIIKHSGGPGNICHLVFEMEKDCFDVEKVADKLRVSPLIEYFRGVHCKSFLLTGRSWARNGNYSKLPDVVIVEPKPFEESDLSFIHLSIATPPAIQIRLYTNYVIVFSWHHSLLDAHGAEIFCRNLSSLPENIAPTRLRLKPPLFMQFQENRKLVRHIFRQARGVSAVVEPMIFPGNTCRYLHHLCDTVENNSISSAAAKSGAELFLSLYVLAGATRAYRNVFNIDSKTPLLIPVPHDCRRRGSRASTIGNQLTFLYFRDKSSNALRNSFFDLVEQMHTAIESRYHLQNFQFMEMCRYLPLPLYTRLLLKPAQGQLGTFVFSDIGSTSDELTDLGGMKVSRVIHYPPNLAPPGLTLVTGTRKGRRFLTIVHDIRYIDEEKAASLLQRWRSELSCEGD